MRSKYGIHLWRSKSWPIEKINWRSLGAHYLLIVNELSVYSMYCHGILAYLWMSIFNIARGQFYRVQVGVQSPEGITTLHGVLRRFNGFLKLLAIVSLCLFICILILVLFLMYFYLHTESDNMGFVQAHYPHRGSIDMIYVLNSFTNVKPLLLFSSDGHKTISIYCRVWQQ